MANTNKSAADLLPGGVKQKDIDSWKRDNPEGIHPIKVIISPAQTEADLKEGGNAKKVVKEEEAMTIYLKDPFNDPEIITEALSKDGLECQEFLLAALFLGGDDALFKNKRAKFWAGRKAMGLVEVYKTEVKKI